MPRAYSLDLRERLIDAVEAGSSARAAAKRLQVSASTAVKWVQRKRETGSVEAKPMHGHPPAKLFAAQRSTPAAGGRRTGSHAQADRRAPGRRWHLCQQELPSYLPLAKPYPFKKRPRTPPSKTGRT